MTTAFARLFALGITHGYYGGPSRDFAFTIPTDTSGMLAGHRMIAREIDGELVVASELNAAGSGPMADAGGARLRFGLRLTNPYFGAFTELAAVLPGTLRLYDNDAAPGPLG